MLVEKGKKKRRKLYHFSDLCLEKNLAFHDEYNRVVEKNGKKFKGTSYVLENNIDQNRKHYIEENYDNTLFIKVKCLLHDYYCCSYETLFITD